MTRRSSILLVFALALLGACGSSPPHVTLGEDWPAQVPDPDDYEDITETWTRRDTLRDQYQHVLELYATLKSPQWRAVYAARDAQHRGLAGAARDQRMAQAQAEMAGPYEVQLMVTTWDRRENDLDRGARSVWRVVLVDDQGNEVPPLEIVKDKRPDFTVRADFPAFGDFATAYIARFPREANVLGPGVRNVKLRMSSSRGAVELVWTAR